MGSYHSIAQASLSVLSCFALYSFKTIHVTFNNTLIMEHSFNVRFAQKYGIEEAILAHNFYFWLRKNLANDKHIHIGRVWTYNSNKAFSELFPYINKTKVFRVLKHLEECDIILKGTFNENLWDKTLWYAFSDNGIDELSKCGYDMLDFVKMNHRDNQSESTIPYNKQTYSKQEEIEDKSSTKKEVEEFVERMYGLYPSRCPKRATSLGKTKKDKERIRKLLKCYSMDEIERVFKHEIEEKYDKQYMQNFSTFLNNFPDPNALECETLFSNVETPSEESCCNNLIINGILYR